MHSSGKSAGAGRVLEHEVLGCIGPMIQSRDETFRHFVVAALETMREYCSFWPHIQDSTLNLETRRVLIIAPWYGLYSITGSFVGW
jgi:hypothetical protein